MVSITLLEVSEKEEGVVAIEPLKTRSGLELVPGCEPSTFQPIKTMVDIVTAHSGPVFFA